MAGRPRHPARSAAPGAAPDAAPDAPARCALDGTPGRPDELVRVSTLRPGLQERIRRLKPDLEADAFVSRAALARVRADYVTDLLRQERGELSAIEKEVVQSLAVHNTLAQDPDESYDERRTFGERAADGLARFGGSWTFLIVFGLVVVAWMALNVGLARRGPDAAFDPYPFILLNLVLSCLAAMQAPVIMMSQRRQEAKDRLRAAEDYRVNLKAELEIRHLHEKLDHLLHKQWERMGEIQELQIELLDEIAGRSRRAGEAAAAGAARAEAPSASSEAP